MSQLQDHLDTLRQRQAPIPVTRGQALAQAKRLRDIGMDYTAIAQAMGVYHGEWAAGCTWRQRLQYAGLYTPKPYKDGSPRIPPQGAKP